MDRKSYEERVEELRRSFEESEKAWLAKGDVVPYKQSLLYFREILVAFDYAYEQGKQEGLRRAREETIKKGMEKGIRDVARNLKANGEDIELIAKLTELSPEEIMRL